VLPDGNAEEEREEEEKKEELAAEKGTGPTLAASDEGFSPGEGVEWRAAALRSLLRRLCVRVLTGRGDGKIARRCCSSDACDGEGLLAWAPEEEERVVAVAAAAAALLGGSFAERGGERGGERGAWELESARAVDEEEAAEDDEEEAVEMDVEVVVVVVEEDDKDGSCCTLMC